ncbi:hypothetical protein SODALDRAFT_303434 [Sodiomyces alkalinus F11]|uniref:DUF3752 domain-containing protein n=1 Tax=Sodiomyces alkalinus (strain CBS 110278 / VKM F-3762 / F11) TaxID=1314773 RepID=A0A3N2Q653_SODAK|nr:hypothetical protein SODALDRAFT_303434 [Sodiomyces alkalinus F11]ROT42259.1 hypothetical protein SODALDRAFT_303434 [Sodiomyces alkalinus F11]
MSSIGPQLPPNLTKRKRTPDDQDDARSPAKQARNAEEIELGDESSSDEYGPSAPKERSPAGPKASIGPFRPTPATSKSNKPSPPSPSERRIGPSLPPQRTIGPAAPPPLDYNPTAASSPASSDSEDDGYGPALPTSNPSSSTTTRGPQVPRPDATPAAPQGPQRDDWMLAPPTASGYRERDPTKLKARRFATNKPHAPTPAAAGGPSEISSIWTETPEQKRKRLEDAVLGRAAPAGSDLEAATSGQGRRRTREDDERDRKRAERIAAARGKSLYEEHQEARRQQGNPAGSRKTGDYRPRKDGVEEEEDDPSKRAFDREKDMALGGRIGTAQRRELLNKAKDFGGRFQKGSYL